jgi:hypothetical protein
MFVLFENGSQYGEIADGADGGLIAPSALSKFVAVTKA